MGQYIKEIAMTVAGIIVFASVCEIIFPDGVYKKYVNLAFGIILILAFISPFEKVSSGGKTFDIDFGKFELYEESANFRKSINYSEKEATERISDVYIQKLNKQISKDIYKTFGMDTEVCCNITKNDENFGKIEDINVSFGLNIESETASEVQKSVAKKYELDLEQVNVIKNQNGDK